jgi:hypothetical protein
MPFAKKQLVQKRVGLSPNVSLEKFQSFASDQMTKQPSARRTTTVSSQHFDSCYGHFQQH